MGEIMLLIFVFVIAGFLGVELISKVPSQLHTPLMSGTNAISGITIVCAMSATAVAVLAPSSTLGMVFGRKAPRLIAKDVIDRMQPGSIIVDMAVSTGGNVEGSKLFEEVVTDNGVIIMSGDFLERQVPFDASKMLSGNFTAFLTHFYNKEQGEFAVNPEDEIMRGCLLTQGGKIIHERFKED
jgi:NAD/NADP transhydrogenase alpha subunit